MYLTKQKKNLDMLSKKKKTLDDPCKGYIFLF